MSRSWRTTRYGSSVTVALVGVALGATIPGTLGGTLATVLIGIGLVGVLSLIFYEVGISEDRDRARRAVPPAPEEGPAPPATATAPSAERSARTRRLDRRRGERRRLP